MYIFQIVKTRVRNILISPGNYCKCDHTIYGTRDACVSPRCMCHNIYIGNTRCMCQSEVYMSQYIYREFEMYVSDVYIVYIGNTRCMCQYIPHNI